MTTALTVAALVAAGTWLVLRRGLLRVVVGFVLLGHGVNLLVLTAGGTERRGFALPGDQGDGPAADPLPQAFVLTAVVIAFAVTVHLLGLLRQGHVGTSADAAADRSGGSAASTAQDGAVEDDAEGPR